MSLDSKFMELARNLVYQKEGEHAREQSRERKKILNDSVTKKIRESEYRDAVELKSVWAVRPTDLLQAINEHKPTIVHFSGHGSNNDELVLQDDSSNKKFG